MDFVLGTTNMVLLHFSASDVLISKSQYIPFHDPKLDSLVHVRQLSGPFTAAFSPSREK